MMEVDNYVEKVNDPITEYTFFLKPEQRDPQKLVEARKAATEEFAQMSRYFKRDFLAGPLSAADFSLYPFVRFMYRARVKLPDFAAAGALPPALNAWTRGLAPL